MPPLKALVYLLCFLASAGCAWLLVRHYWRNRTRFLLWGAICFVLLALNNLLVFFDIVVLPTSIDLLPARRLASLAAVGVLLFGFVWEADE